MNTRKSTIILLIFSLVGLVVGYLLSHPYILGLCIQASVYCYNLLTKGFVLYYGMMGLAVVFLVLLFMPKAFSAWKKFAIWFVPIAAILLAVYPEPSDWDILPDPETLAQWVSGIYVAISAVIIALATGKRKVP